MWTTNKFIVTEIKKAQEELKENLNNISNTQKEHIVFINDQIAELNDKINLIEAKKQKEEKLEQNNHIEIISSLNELRGLMYNLENNICKYINENVQQINQHTLSSSNNEIRVLSKKLQLATEKICGKAEDITEKGESYLQDGIQQLKNNSLANTDKIICSTIEKMNSEFEHVEKIIQDNCNDASEIREKNNLTLSAKLQSVTNELHTMALSIESNDALFTENISSMNIAMQGIMKSLLTLDEGNRLVIAKLLLKDLGN